MMWGTVAVYSGCWCDETRAAIYMILVISWAVAVAATQGGKLSALDYQLYHVDKYQLCQQQGAINRTRDML